MKQGKDVAKTESKPIQHASESERHIHPAVDIYEDKNGISLHADMPGVSKDRLDIKIDNDVLSIEGEAEIQMPEDMEAVYADVRSTHYKRQFTLSRELDGEKADACLKDGVLTLHIPKREQFQPRKIEVRTN